MEGNVLKLLGSAVNQKTYEICRRHDADIDTASKVASDVSRVVEELVNAGHKTERQVADKVEKIPSESDNGELNSFLKFVLNFPIDNPQGERTLWGVIRDNRNLGKSIGVFTEDVNGRDYLFIYPSDAAGYFGATHHVTSTDIARVLLSTQIAERCNIRLGKFTFKGHRIPIDYILANVELKEVAETSESAPVRCYDGEPLAEPLKPTNGESPDAMRSVEGLPPSAPSPKRIPIGSEVAVSTYSGSTYSGHVVCFIEPNYLVQDANGRVNLAFHERVTLLRECVCTHDEHPPAKLAKDERVVAVIDDVAHEGYFVRYKNEITCVVEVRAGDGWKFRDVPRENVWRHPVPRVVQTNDSNAANHEPHNPLAVATIPVGTKVKVIPLKSEAVGTVTWSLDGLHTVKFSDDSGDFHLQRMPCDTLQVVDDANPLSRDKVINSLTVAAQLANGKPLRIAAKMVESILHHLTH